MLISEHYQENCTESSNLKNIMLTHSTQLYSLSGLENVRIIGVASGAHCMLGLGQGGQCSAVLLGIVELHKFVPDVLLLSLL